MLPLLKTDLVLDQFGLFPRIADILPYITLLTLIDETKKSKQQIVNLLETLFLEEVKYTLVMLFLKWVNTSEIMTFLEKQSQALTQKYTGPFLSEETYMAYFRGYFYSGFFLLHWFTLPRCPVLCSGDDPIC